MSVARTGDVLGRSERFLTPSTGRIAFMSLSTDVLGAWISTVVRAAFGDFLLRTWILASESIVRTTAAIRSAMRYAGTVEGRSNVSRVPTGSLLSFALIAFDISVTT
jgi:hypothetical protein